MPSRTPRPSTPRPCSAGSMAASHTPGIAGSSSSCSARKRPTCGPRPPTAPAVTTPARPSSSRSIHGAPTSPSSCGQRCFAAPSARSTSPSTPPCFLHEQFPDLNDLLRDKADAGCRIRIATGDPDGERVNARGNEERFGHGIASRCQLALMHYRPLIGQPRISIHLHDTTLYNSIYRFDDGLLVNTHVWGWNAYGAPNLRYSVIGRNDRNYSGFYSRDRLATSSDDPVECRSDGQATVAP